MHAVGSVGGGSGGGGGRAGRAGGRSPRSYKSSKADNDDGRRGGGCGGGEEEKAGMGPVYRIGKHKFRLDGKDGKTLDDIIEVSAEWPGTECRVSHLVAVLGWVDSDLGESWAGGMRL